MTSGPPICRPRRSTLTGTLGLCSLLVVLGGAAYSQTQPTLELQVIGGELRLIAHGEPGSQQTILVRDTLEATNRWTVLTNLTLTSESVRVADFSPSPSASRFYQAMMTPPGLVFIPPGAFTMGSPESDVARHPTETPQTEVTITRGFWMGQREVSQGEYMALMEKNPSYFTNGFPAFGSGSGVTNQMLHPVEQVLWEDATNYCGRLTERERAAGRLLPGYAYRLPTEAEWEYACRAGTTTAYYFGTALRSGMANFDATYEYDSETGHIPNPDGIWLGQTVPGGRYAPNAWGLYDMHGNVWEWCQDWWSERLPGGSVTDPLGPPAGVGHVLRGGCWSSYGWFNRSAFRLYEGRPESCSDGGTGFRVVLARAP